MNKAQKSKEINNDYTMMVIPCDTCKIYYYNNKILKAEMSLIISNSEKMMFQEFFEYIQRSSKFDVIWQLVPNARSVA